jgi:adenylate cyclase
MRHRSELLGLGLGLIFALVHRATTVPRVGLSSAGASMMERAFQFGEARAADLKFRVRGPVAPHPDVLVATIDEKSVKAFGQWPWSRHLMGAAFERLAAAHVRAVGMDVAFTDSRDQEERFAQATLDRLRNVQSLPPDLEGLKETLTLAVENSPDAALERGLRALGPKLVQGVIPIEPGHTDDFSREEIETFNRAISPYVVRSVPGKVKGSTFELPIEALSLWTAETGQTPQPRFMNASSVYGHFAMIPDLDGTIRRMALWGKLRGPRGLIPSMALQTAAVALEGQARPMLEDGQVTGAVIDGPHPRFIPFEDLAPFSLIDYPGPMSTVPQVSIVDVIEGRVAERLEGKVVLVGVTIVGSSGDQRVTPYRELEPGVLTHAAVVSNILANRFLRRPYELVLIEMLLVTLFSLALGAAIPRLPAVFKAVAIGSVVVVWLVASYLAFRSGFQVAVAAPVTGLLATSFAVTFFGYVAVDREKLKMRSTFSRYLGSEVMDIALENPERLNRGEKREMTVLFSDIRGFTTLSEQMSPEALAAFINDYLSPMTAIVFDEKGTLDKYIGDALMAFWNAPMDQSDHAFRACRAAVKMIERLEVMKRSWHTRGLPALEIGIGVNTGPMVVGNMGSDVRVDYTVLGDAVNLGSRLEGLNKEYGTRIIISESTFERVREHVVTRRLGAVRVKGKRLPVNLYELRALGRPNEEELRVIVEFERAVTLFSSRAFEEAASAFVGVLREWPTDLATQRYLAHIEAFKVHPPSIDWDGVSTLSTK